MGNTPNIRFKGFTDDWEQRKLGDVFEQTANIVNPNEEKIELWSLTVEDGLTSKTERYNREFLVKKDNNFKEVRPGDIVYNPMNMTLGAVGYNGMSKSVAVSGYYTTMIANEGYDSYYINTWLKGPQAISLYKIFATGSLIEKQRVQFSTLSIIPATFPNYEEQQKIGQYFSNLDHIITLHQRKCDETKKLKKFMLQKMFPKKDEKKPEIRFAGFTDDWEQRKFGSLLKETREKTKIENEDTLLSCAINGMYLNSELFSHFRGSSNIGYLKVKKNDLILSSQNLHLGNCNVNLRFEHGIISPAYKVYELVACDPLFIQAWVKQDSTKDFFLNASTEGASVCRKNIVWNELYKQTLPIPKIKEQEQIGKYFNELDNLITLHQRKCDEIKEIKKFMLKNMFPQKG